MYRLVVFLHVVGVFGFLMAHGTSAVVALKLRHERDPVRVGALLDLSSSSLGLLYASILLLLASGVVAGFMGGWWGSGWIWTGLGLLVLLIVAMYPLASAHYDRVRQAVGIQTYRERKQGVEPRPPASAEAIDRILRSPRPYVVAAVGGVGLLIILWLMMFKPF